MLIDLPGDWMGVLGGEFRKLYFRKLDSFLESDRSLYTVLPPERDVFNAFKVTSYNDTRVLILGQDPYHDYGQAHGMSFSVPPGMQIPPSLLNIYKELENDIPGFKRPNHGCLIKWAEQGVLLLNSVLTVRLHDSNSHKSRGWEQFTDAVIYYLSNRDAPMVFVLWGNYAKRKLDLIDSKKHLVIESAHPSPLSVRRGFFGSKPFSRINDFLRSHDAIGIDWNLPAI